jgi:hypothetical protein
VTLPIRKYLLLGERDLKAKKSPYTWMLQKTDASALQEQRAVNDTPDEYQQG